MWSPADQAHVEARVESDLEECTHEQRALFEAIRIPIRSVAIERTDGGENLERVFVVAECGARVVYFEDIHLAFELDRVDDDGVLRPKSLGQFDLSHVLYHLLLEQADSPAPARQGMREGAPKAPLIQTDFNGFLGPDLVCLAHHAAPTDHLDRPVQLHVGMYVIAFDLDGGTEDEPEYLIASGTVERSSADASHRGSVWSLRIDSRGVRAVAKLDDAD